ncbi:MAG: molybdenum cofactor biosynthesis protein MoaE [Muricauda sp.]|jgi:molybdopterin synthase catalytic subunit|nr:molybdenum cofactor biosynthesis protein MoaE [Allomuricauda sp.]MBO6532885.1 molybdenum cofactor biosynthesis protein MoaE [Allomuricauda sp.]MBO6589161.1 molybdenum cofactor biosynthesis protein MoaE [Allomuricauda sp.]MBO6618786.1 molybdenum cofactor biosynthesis protein MoaE [Allomuricauda sp.]MBO6644699.1 molybdenum cofactor biosynthesis protein MoaE [Allomuricauda sp.]MBO6746599.1 molybdenum cofactor biosynthesis protein MoaE [Allomuricauda sp.]
MDKKKPKKVFVQGAIPPEKIATSVANHQSKTNIGAHSIFLGQVRADAVDGKTVTAIDYTAYEEMAENVFHDIREAAFAKFDITCAHIYHSLGKVNVGELCLFVFTSSAHRKIAIEATNFFVEEIKAKVPVFGKEIFEDETHQWKVNT